MKCRFVKIALLFCLSLWGYSVPAQKRICDLEAFCISPADTVINGEALILRFGRKNLGPDIMLANDTTYYRLYRIVDGNRKNDYSGWYGAPPEKYDTVRIGDSTIYGAPYGIPFNYPGLTEPLVLDYCVQLDSWKTNAWGDTLGFNYLDTNSANNTCCKQVVVMPAPQVAAISDLGGTLGKFFIYPNPVAHTLYLRTEPGFRSSDVRVSVVDLMGRTLLVKYASELHWNKGGTSIDISAFPAGLYQVNLFTAKGIKTRRFAIYK